MKTYLLDTSAILTLRDDEPGADDVANLLSMAQEAKVRCLGCFISLMEMYYRVWKDEGKTAGHLAYEQCQSLPITWIHESPALLQKAAAIKACHPVSLADAWIAACAILEDAKLVHKDPEFKSIKLKQFILPLKKRS